MYISTSTWLEAQIGYKENIKLIKEAGFSAFDLGLDCSKNILKEYFSGADYLDKAHDLREYVNSLGFTCNQSHAPFGSHLGEATKDSQLFGQTVRSMEIASVLGAKGIVIHPMQFLPYCYNKNELKEINYRFYSELLPFAEKYNIIIYTENMYQGHPASHVPVPSVCAWADEFCEYIDMINSPHFKGCLDIGHTTLTGESLTRMIETLGADRLAALHIHDVKPQEDTHTIPYLCSVNYEEMLNGLKKIGYKGDITFESGNFERSFPKELYLPALKFTAEIGKYFKTRVE